jgi:hypothetical protein
VDDKSAYLALGKSSRDADAILDIAKALLQHGRA